MRCAFFALLPRPLTTVRGSIKQHFFVFGEMTSCYGIGVFWMKWLFGQNFWIFRFGFLLIASYLSAVSVNNLLHLSIKPQIAAPLALAADDDIQLAKARKDARVVLKGPHLFDANATITDSGKKDAKDAKKKEEEEKKDEKSKIIEVPGCPPFSLEKEFPETKLPKLNLKGTSIADDPAYNLAALYLEIDNPKPAFETKGMWKKKSLRVEIFRVGDTLSEGARLCAITRRRIVFLHKGKLEQISLEPKDKKKDREALYGSFGASEEEEKFNADKVDNRSLSRSVVQDWLANPMSHAMSARVMPHYEGGKQAGFRLVWIKEGSLYSKLGLKSGDIIQQINDKPLSVGSALGLMSQLPYAKDLSVNLIRGGVRQSINFNIK
jgi:hypothetical protein